MDIVALGLDFKGRQLFKPMTEENFAKSLVNAIESNIENVRDLAKATTEGVVRPPSGLVMTIGLPASITATTEFVVPRSIPMILLMSVYPPARPKPRF